MPFVQLADYKIHYELTGAASAPVLVLSNSLGTTTAMWERQLAEFEKSFRVLRYDTRGHGQSEVTTGPYTFGQLAQDVVRLLDALKIEQAAFLRPEHGRANRIAAGTGCERTFQENGDC